MMRSASVYAAVLVVSAFAFGCAGEPSPVVELTDVHAPNSFETEERAAGWMGGEGVTVARSREHASRGRWSLKVTIPGNRMSGLEYYPSNQDWSGYTLLSLDVHWPSTQAGPLRLGLRVDDAQSEGYATRFNLDDGSIALVPGDNTIELSMRELASGRPGTRGLDLRHIKALYLFPVGEHPEVTFYVDNVRFELREAEPRPDVVVIEQFENADRLRHWDASEGVCLDLTEEHATRGAKALKLTLPAGPYPGVSTSRIPENWLPYEWLRLDVFNTGADTMHLGLWARDAAGTKVTVGTVLGSGPNDIRIPVDVFSALRLRQVKTVCLFVTQPSADTTIVVDNLRLERRAAATVYPETLKGPTVILDYQALKALRRNSGFLANVYTSDGGGPARLLRLRPTEKHLVKQAVAVPAGEAVVSSFFLDHGTWFLNTRTIDVPTSGVTVRYEPGDFGR